MQQDGVFHCFAKLIKGAICQNWPPGKLTLTHTNKKGQSASPEKALTVAAVSQLAQLAVQLAVWTGSWWHT